ncbi:MAG: hypothetical protein RLZZ616_3040, partial [Pseudomonadota bacterium]
MPPVVYGVTDYCCGTSSSLESACSTSADGTGKGAADAGVAGVTDDTGTAGASVTAGIAA